MKDSKSLALSTVNLSHFGDSRGSLVSIESMKSIPFPIKRVYYIYETISDTVRGCHAHYELEQCIIAISGSCTLTLDNGTCRVDHLLNDKKIGVLIGKNIWRELHGFSDDCILLILASEHYTESDYIRNYDEFLKYSSQ